MQVTRSLVCLHSKGDMNHRRALNHGTVVIRDHCETGWLRGYGANERELLIQPYIDEGLS